MGGGVDWILEGCGGGKLGGMFFVGGCGCDLVGCGGGGVGLDCFGSLYFFFCIGLIGEGLVEKKSLDVVKY